ncbi:MAG: EAL domain-containing protein [Rhodospirillales bacterium]
MHAICVVVDTTERRRSEARLAHLAHHDPLTGLANRNLLGIRLGEAMTRAAAGEAFAILCIDLDRFKDVNDMFGHAVGDALLIAVAARMAAALRPHRHGRPPGRRRICRHTNPDRRARQRERTRCRLIAVLGEPFDIAGNHIVISVSIGIAIAGEKTPDSERLLRNADIAMYAAKTTGARRYRIFATEMDEKIQARCRLETELRQAFDNNEFELFYQPLVNVDTHLPCAFEALLRWRHPREGLVMPSRFIQVAETTGLIVPIGAWILQTACTEAARWPNDLRVSVNLSAVQFSDGDLLQAIKVALCKSGLNPRRLELEITESVMLRDTMATLEALHEMKTLGVSVAMDDFGTGYSSLSYLQRFPFDRLKIDRSFVASLGTTQESRAIVEAVVCLCSGLGIGTIAEGVETKTQLAVLTGNWVHRGAGVSVQPAVLDQTNIFGNRTPREFHPCGSPLGNRERCRPRRRVAQRGRMRLSGFARRGSASRQRGTKN